MGDYADYALFEAECKKVCGMGMGSGEPEPEKDYPCVDTNQCNAYMAMMTPEEQKMYGTPFCNMDNGMAGGQCELCMKVKNCADEGFVNFLGELECLAVCEAGGQPECP